MKAVLIGLGGFGSAWYRRMRGVYKDRIELAVVDTNPDKKAVLNGEDVPFYTSVEEAIECERPDIIINVTPRQSHTAINHLALDHKLPIFCEKPIAANYEDAVAVVERAEREGIPLMIAENYRTYPASRKLKQLLSEGAIGDLLTLDCDFYRQRDKDKRDFEDPASVLEELNVHHFDLLRYWTGREVGKLYAVKRHQMQIVMDMQMGIQATLRCSTSTFGRQTDWTGDWRIEGTKGTILFVDKQITLTTEAGTIHIADFADAAAPGPFDEFLLSLEQGRPAETSGRDYLKNQALAHYARQSLSEGRPVDTSPSWGYGPMIVRNYLKAETHDSVSHHGLGKVRGARLFDGTDFETPIKFLGYSEIPPGASIGYHGHRDDEEIYIVLAGSGQMTVNGETYRVRAGDVLLNKPWWKHGLENDGEAPLKAIIFEVGK
ncbi:cupin domain-containing protein [Paenibacillus sp. HWE-109]|uniref:cupin domain-containing protein n=1 Tax=Paenibacillus sp. HWE-109 TaxID=1306526 RepID=UPI001EDF2435|nr:cupin domain-containing protein [Paenibacillus sp. HWE-109]UKS30948.1 cupin domain-containing protein [Paenibacillus sp. HWE-109]